MPTLEPGPGQDEHTCEDAQHFDRSRKLTENSLVAKERWGPRARNHEVGLNPPPVHLICPYLHETRSDELVDCYGFIAGTSPIPHIAGRLTDLVARDD